MGTCTDRYLTRSTAPTWGEHTARVQALVLWGPFAAEVRFGRPAVGPYPPVQAAAYSIIVKEPTSGDHFRLDGEVARPVYLAEIR